MPDIHYTYSKISAKIRKYGKRLSVPACTLAVICLGVADHVTGPEISFSIFYLLPISIAAFYSGRMAGLFISVVSAATWLAADLLSGAQYSYRLIPYWNAAVRLGYFSLHTVLLSMLVSLIEEMKQMALRDPLTGAFNWRFFAEEGYRELQKMRRSRIPLTLAYIDLDNFKSVNDTFGHDAGDDLLRSITEAFQHHIRPGDVIARVGGDEFALLLPETSSTEAGDVLKRLFDLITRSVQNQHFAVTISVGAVTCTVPPPSLEELVKNADRLMYEVKKKGKNGIRHEEWPPAKEKSSG